ncbi:MAG TPA: hypothetical protein VMZ92_17255 [Planctomycetota bacterium]|nr:hypothetical protein [Planctomycetota bacterium]
MDKGIFAEVKRIEEEAEEVLAEARRRRDDLLQKADTEAVDCRKASARKLEAEKTRLHEQHERELFEARLRIEEDFEARKDRLNRTAETRTDDLADHVAGRFLERSP